MAHEPKKNTATIIIRTSSEGQNEEEEEEIVIDEEHLITSEVESPEVYGSYPSTVEIAYGTVVASTSTDNNVLEDGRSLFHQGRANNNSGGGRYFINTSSSNTGDDGNIELMQLDDDTFSVEERDHGESVEIVAVDVNPSNFLFIDSGSNDGETTEMVQNSHEIIQALVASNDLKCNSTVTPATSISSTGMFISSRPKKTAPALLRNSRRAAVAKREVSSPNPSTSASASSTMPNSGTANKTPQQSTRSTISATTASSSNRNAKAKVVSSNVKSSTKSAFSSASSLLKLESSSLKTDSNVRPVVPQPVYIIYQDESGEQVAQILDSTQQSSFLSDNRTITDEDIVYYQILDNKLVVRSTEGGKSNKNTLTSHKVKSKPRSTSPQKKKLNKEKMMKASVVNDASNKKKKAVSELKCMENNCSVVGHNILELRKHLTDAHDMTFDYETLEFASDTVFKEWRQQYERERMVSFIYRGGTKKISKEQAVAYMICHRSGHYKSNVKETGKRKRKMKPQGTCKIGGYCTAGIKILKSLLSGEVKVEICHTHYGHPLDSEAIPHLRVNSALRKLIQKKFEEGMSFADMLAYIHHNPDRLEGLRMVDRRAVRNIHETWKLTKSNPELKRVKVTKTEGGNNRIETQARLQCETETEQVFQDCTALITEVSQIDPLADDRSNDDDIAPLLQSMDQVINNEETVEGYISSEDVAPPVLVDVRSLAVPVYQPPKKKKKSSTNETNATATAKYPSCSESVSLSLSQAKKTRRRGRGSTDCIQNIQISPELDTTIDRLHNHGESGPTILLYKTVGDINIKYGGFGRYFRESDYCLVIQTPVQRQILQMFPKVINFDIVDKVNKSGEQVLKLGYFSVLDDYREAIPVVWFVVDSMCSRIFHQVCRTLRYHCGELPVQYIMAPKDVNILRPWNAHFSHKPKLLQHEVLAKRELRNLLNRHIPNNSVRCNVWTILEEMIQERYKDNLKDQKQKICSMTKDCVYGGRYMQKLQKDWLSRIPEWSFAYRNGANCNLLFVSDSFLKFKKFVGLKTTQKLNETVDHILKIGYDKCFLRTKRMFKGDQKFSHVLETMERFHVLAETQLNESSVISTSSEGKDESKWIIELSSGNVDEKKATVEVRLYQSPCDCKIICKSCKICMHQYTCSCNEFMNDHVMCAHIHKVHIVQNKKNGNYKEEEKKDQEEAKRNRELETTEDAEESQDHYILSRMAFDDKANSIICQDGTEITTTINENQIENLTEALQTVSALLSDSGQQELSQIISISSDTIVENNEDSNRIIFDGTADSGDPVVFELEFVD